MWELVGGGRCVGLSVYVLLFTVPLTIWPAFSFLSCEDGAPQWERLHCCCSGLLSLLFASSCCALSPRGPEWWANTSNKCCSLFFPNGATKNNTQSRKPLQVFQHQYQRRCLSQRAFLRESRWNGCRESEWSHPNLQKRKKNMHAAGKDESVKMFSDKMFVLKYDYLRKGEWCLSSMQQCLKKCIKNSSDMSLSERGSATVFIQYLMRELLCENE